LSPGETDTAIARVVNRVKPLQEWHAANEVKSRAEGRCSHVLYGQVNELSAEPDLSVRSQFKCLAADDKVERLEALVLRVGNAEEVCAIV
jgi:hypothetical protein